MKVLYKIKSGSHLYGLTTPTSDVDYVGVYVEDSFNEFIDPFDTKDEIDMSIKSKMDNGKNDSDAVDEKYFHLKKFIKLCSDNNPNILEMLFAPEDCIEYVDPEFKSLILDCPKMFVNAKLIDRFIGYAKSQEQKSYTKSGNYITLEAFKRSLEHFSDYKGSSSRLRNFIEMDYANFSNSFNNSHKIIQKYHSIGNVELILVISEMEFPLGITTKEAINRINDRFSRASHRVEGILINKYEPKFMSHTIRLLDEGYQLLTDGKISFPFTGKVLQDIMDIKLGKTEITSIPELVNFYKDRLSDLELHHNLPKTADYERIKIAYTTFVTSIYFDELSE